MTQPSYKYSDHYVASFQHLRNLNTALRDDLLSKDGGIVSAPIYETTQTDGQRLATRQYVLDNSGGGGGGGSSHDEIHTQDQTTSVKTILDGITFKDNDTQILTISNDNAIATKLKGELNGLVIATDDVTIKSKDESSIIATFNSQQIQTTTSILQNNPQGGLNGHLTRKDYVDQLVANAKNSISKLVDANSGEDPITNNYQLKIDNNQLEFANGLASDDIWLKWFATTDQSTDGVIQSTNRSNYFMETEDDSVNELDLHLRHKFNATAGSTYQKSAPLRLTSGTTGSTPFSRISALNVTTDQGSSNTSLLLYPTNSLTTNVINKINATKRIGYQPAIDLSQQDSDSILNRNENDARYYLNNTPLNQITLANGSINVNGNKLVGLQPASQSQDAVNLDQLSAARQGFSQVRKTTTAQSVNSKVTGFSLQLQSNAVKCAWDNTNQVFQINIPPGDASVDIEFRVRVAYQITATGNSATFVLRNFTSSTNFADTFLYASKQNQTGFFSEALSIIKNFTGSTQVGLYVTAQNGSPPFASLDIVMQAVSITTTTQVSIPGLVNAEGTFGLSMGSAGLFLTGSGQNWFLNNALLYGAQACTEQSDFDQLTDKAYVDGQVQNLLIQADGYQFKTSGIANAFVIEKLSTNDVVFAIQSDISNSTILQPQNDLRLTYLGSKTLSNDSIMRKEDIISMNIPFVISNEMSNFILTTNSTTSSPPSAAGIDLTLNLGLSLSGAINSYISKKPTSIVYRRISNFRFAITLQFPAGFNCLDYVFQPSVIGNAAPSSGAGVYSSSYDPAITWITTHYLPTDNTKVIFTVTRLATDGGQELKIGCVMSNIAGSV